MKKSELKKVLKPLIKECVKEAILEEGVLSGIISEVVRGLGNQQMVVEAAPAPKKDNEKLKRIKQEHQQALHEQRKMLSDSLGKKFGGVDLFEGVNPVKAGVPSSGPTAPGSPLEGVDPNDPGIDLSQFGFGGVR